MDRRVLITTGLVALGMAGRAAAQTPPTATNPDPDRLGLPPPGQPGGPPGPSGPPAPPLDTGRAQPYERDEIVNTVSDFLGVTAEAAGAAIERIFKENGKPTAYVAGEEGSAAITLGARYGRGLLYMKQQPQLEVFWQGPSIGWDVGGNASRVFTLCYNLQYPDAIFRRFPGVEGTAYLIGGVGVNYQRADDIVLAPIRAGVGIRLGANIGYLAYSRKRRLFPF
ncbi:hypothetical protein BH11PSE2_BH11PSE2_17030 [soil metagenome]